jgi:Fe-S-cluster containining protein
MALPSDHYGLFIQGMTTPDELKTYLRQKYGDAEIRAAYERLLREAQAMSRAENIPPLKAFWKLLDRAFAERAATLKCGRGCAHCCHTGVTATQLEWEGIVENARRKGIDLHWIIERARKSVERVRQALESGSGREPADWHRLVVNQPCPFLNAERACDVYEDRPLDCRLVAAFRAVCESKNLEHAQRGVWVEEAAGAAVIARLQHEQTPRLMRGKFDGTQPLALLQHWLIAWEKKGKKRKTAGK